MLSVKVIGVSARSCPFDDKVNPSSLYSVEDCNHALEDRGIGPEALMYAILVYAVADCPETAHVKGEGVNPMSMTNKYHGYMFWWLMQQFLCHAVERGYFSVPGLSDEDGTADKLSSLAKMKEASYRRKHDMADAIEAVGGKVPDLGNFFFRLPAESEYVAPMDGEEDDSEPLG